MELSTNALTPCSSQPACSVDQVEDINQVAPLSAFVPQAAQRRSLDVRCVTCWTPGCIVMQSNKPHEQHDARDAWNC